MAGGLFDDQPFSVNIKCVLVTVAVALYYYYYRLEGVGGALLSSAALYVAITYGYNTMYACHTTTTSNNNDDAGLAALVLSAAFGVALYYRRKARRSVFLLTLGAMLYLPYLLLAWWDYRYNCNTRMDPTIFPLGRFVYLPLKPPDYRERWYTVLTPAQQQTIARYDAWFLWIAYAALVSWSLFYTRLT